ncbi:MAG: tRNA uridine-5-carboxymethylaminomethyl(34) synthesis GTPase MnmE [Clostridia bacterium]|nr:tRNA uridine-5-carboxymethylaminomethyl(34) synthesis GTPase MnmE [Clostridia bacterium]
MNAITNVIAAVSTPPGKGGVAIIRVSGDGAFDIAERLFSARSGRALTSYPARVQIYGHVIYGGAAIDDVLLTKFPSPHSYTGEDTVEISCHGGTLVTRAVLEAVLSEGAVPAGPGEFTKRAFINGRLSLSEAEAIASLLEAETLEQVKLASVSSRSRFAERVAKIRAALTDLMSSIYARIDYPDEDLGDFDDGEIITRLYNIKEELTAFLATYGTGKAISEGVRCALVGKTNVGKSSLYNILVGEDDAIVTDIPGTTRDVLRTNIFLGGVMLRLADTAGIRECNEIDRVEAIGIEKSRKMLAESELLFAIFDVSAPFGEDDAKILEEIKGSSAVKIAVLNKCDLDEKFDTSSLGAAFTKVIRASARAGADKLRAEIADCVKELFLDEKITVGEDAVVSSARQAAILRRALNFVTEALASLAAGFSQDAASSDIERALGAVAELDGRAVSEEIVADIFSKFCVGK